LRNWFVVRGRLWRKSDTALKDETRQLLVDALISALRAIRDARSDPANLALAHSRVDEAKIALRERGQFGQEYAPCRLV
jgi:hypothetical protein